MTLFFRLWVFLATPHYLQDAPVALAVEKKGLKMPPLSYMGNSEYCY